MLKKVKVRDLNYAGRKLTTYSIVKQRSSSAFEPLLPASLWLLSLAVSGNSEKTNETYASHLCQFLSVMTTLGKGDKGWKEINERDVNGYFFGYMNQTRELSEVSIAAHATAIQGYYQWAYEHGYLKAPINFSDTLEGCRKEAQNSTGIKKKIAVLTRQYMDEDTFKKLLIKNEMCNPYLQERNRLALKLGYYMGLRAEEVVQDVYLNTERLKSIVPNKPTSESLSIAVLGKGNKVRKINAKPELVDDIRKFLYGRRSERRSGPLIAKEDGTQLNSQYASKLFRKIAAKMDDEYEVWCDRSFHVLRKCYATNLVTWCYEQGIDPWVLVMERLGHESLSTTKVYIFFEAVINKRASIISKLSLENSSFRNIWGRNNA